MICQIMIWLVRNIQWRLYISLKDEYPEIQVCELVGSFNPIETYWANWMFSQLEVTIKQMKPPSSYSYQFV